MKNILVVGGAGYIGTRLSNWLFELGYHVHVVDNFWFGDQLCEGISKRKGNLWDLKAKDLHEFDAVLFLAGLSNDPMAMFRPDLNFIENASAPMYLGFICKEAGVRRFICASSCSVYGFTKNRTLNEHSSVKPAYAYGISKLQCELGLETLEDHNFKPIIFRKGTVGGWSPKMRYDLVVNTMLKTGITKGEIVVHNPAIWRPLIDIRDVIQGYRKALEADINVSGIYNLSGGNITIGDLGEQVHKELINRGFKVDLIVLGNSDVRNYKVSTEKIEDELGFKAEFKPVDSLCEILDNINLDGYDFNNDLYSNIATFERILLK
jgi:nucleoside-diphosphate-sugar epimerase